MRQEVAWRAVDAAFDDLFAGLEWRGSAAEEAATPASAGAHGADSNPVEELVAGLWGSPAASVSNPVGAGNPLGDLFSTPPGSGNPFGGEAAAQASTAPATNPFNV